MASLHPWAWWLWALGIAGAVGLSANPLVLLLAIAVLGLVVTARRGDSPWACAFVLYLWLAGFIVGFRLLMYVLVGMKYGEIPLLTLPAVDMPEWAAGISILGPVYLEGLVQSGLEGLRLGTILIACGAANSLANPKHLVRTLPAALGEVGTAIVIALSIAPQLAESLVRVHRARELRGDSSTGLRGFGRLILPVLQDALDGALTLAASMDARGYGRRALISSAQRRVISGLSFVGLSGLCVGLYAVLDTTLKPVASLTIVLLSCLLVGLSLWQQGRKNITTQYRRLPWRAPEWITASCGLAVFVAVLATRLFNPASLVMPVHPLAPPPVPWLVVLALLAAVIPAVVTPEPPINRPAPARRQHHE